MSAAGKDGERLNIALVTPGFSADETDWCIPALLNLVRRLADAHNVTVYSLRYPHFDGTYRLSGARVRAFGGATAGAWRRLPLLWRAIHAIVADARRQPFSLIHGLWADEAGFVATAAARRLRVPALVSLMGGELARLTELGYGVQLSRSGRLLTRLSLRLANGVSAGSPQMLQQAAQRVARARLHLLPLGVDLAMFRPQGPPLGPPYRIVHVASLSPVKDQSMLITAFAMARVQLAGVDVSLHIAGEGPLQINLVAQARKLQVDDRVILHGALSHERLPDFYRMGHLFALSSRHESQSVAFLEAAACGLPVVGTDVGLLAEHLPRAYRVRPGDVQAMAKAMAGLLRDEDKRHKEGGRLEGLVRRTYGLDRTTGHLVEVYKELVHGTG